MLKKSGSISRLRQFDKLTIGLSALLLLLVLVMVTVVLSHHFRDAGKKADPEVTLHARNCFPRTLRVVGDMDYKPFSYFSEKSVPCGYDIELVNELANRLHCNVELKLVNWNDAVKMIQKKKADVIYWAAIGRMPRSWTATSQYPHSRKNSLSFRRSRSMGSVICIPRGLPS